MGLFSNIFGGSSKKAAKDAQQGQQSSVSTLDAQQGQQQDPQDAQQGQQQAAPAQAGQQQQQQAAPAPSVREIFCPVAGEVIDIAQVSDPAFASKAMGDGVAVVPTEGKLVAPLAGTIEALFPTGHALAIRGEDGLAVMLHIGIDTVDMEGDGFTLHVAQGDHVERGQLLVEFDLQKIADAGHEPTTMVIVAEAPAEYTLVKGAFGPAAIGDRVIWFE